MTSLPLGSINKSAILERFLTNPDTLFPPSPANETSFSNPVVVTGQQVGLFGGPLYTLLKIRTAAKKAEELSQKRSAAVQAVFWLEDCDHDAAEASTAWTPDGSGALVKQTLPLLAGKFPVSTLTYTDEQTEAIHTALKHHDGRYSNELQERLRPLYTSGRSWSDAFLDVLQPYLDAWNVSVIRASDVVKQGHHRELVTMDVGSTDLIEAVHAGSRHLESQGFELQATVGSTLFFLTVDGERQRLHREGAQFRTTDGSTWSAEELLEILHHTPERFTPNVLGRPLVQDMHLPTVHSILGVAELSYHAQLTQAYTLLGRNQPRPLVRNHALLLDSKTERLLEKLGMDPEQFFTPLPSLEEQIVSADAEQAMDQLQTQTQTAAIIAPFANLVQSLDPTLLKTVEGAGNSIEATLDVVRGKIRTAIKRKHSEQLERLRAAWWAIYPNNMHAERCIPLSVYESRFGFDGLRIIVERISAESAALFTIIGNNTTNVQS